MSSGSFYSLNNAIYDKTNSTLSGTVLTRTSYSDSIELTNALPITSGGTGQTTATNALNALLPLQTGQSGKFLTTNGTIVSWGAGGSGSGSVTSVSIVNANGFSGTVANATTTPAITLTTSANGMLKGNATAISAATAGVDYSAGTSTLGTGILKSTTSTGNLSIAIASDFPTLNQNTTGTANNVTGTVAITNGGTGQITQQLAINALAGGVTNAQFLRGNGTNVIMSAIQISDVPTLNQNTSGTSASVTGTNVITNNNLSQMATNTIKGNNTGATANASDLTVSQVTAILDNFVGDSGSGGIKGLVPAPSVGDGVTGKFLKADGSWAMPGSTGNILVGTIIQHISPTLDGYLLCNGTNYNRNDYLALFNLLNTLLGTITLTIANPCVVTRANHGLTTGQTVFFTTTGALPTGVSANTTYFINVTGVNTFNLATTFANLNAGTYVATSGSQNGTHSLYLTIGGVTSVTTFNVPDLRGRVLANINSSHGIGKIIGAETHTLTTNEMPSHNHSVQGYVRNDYDANDVFSNYSGLDTGANQYNTTSVGGGAAHNNMQPTFFIYTHIKF
jgi:microcystin-dependent protein